MCSNAFNHNAIIGSITEELTCRIIDDVKHAMQQNTHVEHVLKVCNDFVIHIFEALSPTVVLFRGYRTSRHQQSRHPSGLLFVSSVSVSNFWPMPQVGHLWT